MEGGWKSTSVTTALQHIYTSGALMRRADGAWLLTGDPPDELASVQWDSETQAALERQLLDLRHGEYVDAEPEGWLSWHGRGIYGPTRYACGEHRDELKVLLRELYGTLGWHPWARGPHPWAGRRGTDRARRLQRTTRAGIQR